MVMSCRVVMVIESGLLRSIVRMSMEVWSRLWSIASRISIALFRLGWSSFMPGSNSTSAVGQADDLGQRRRLSSSRGLSTTPSRSR